MLPASSDAQGVWLHRQQLRLVLRKRYARSVVPTILVWLLSAFELSNASALALRAESPLDLADVKNQVLSFATRDSVGHSSDIQAGWLATDITSPMPRNSAVGPASRWKPRAVGNSWLADHLTLVADDGESEQPQSSEPDIAEPGPDMGDYPNSAFTLPQGRIYVEFAPLTLQTSNPNNPATYSSPFMLRYGLTDDVELRLIGSGLTSVFNSGNTVSGFAPLVIDTKIHMWDADLERLIPAASLEVYIQTNLASEAFRGGVQPSLNLNLDFPVSEKTNLEMTFGYSGVRDTSLSQLNPGVPADDVNVYQFSFQWAVEQQLTDKFQVFVHGYYNGTVFLQSGPGEVIGTGWFYQVSKRLMLFSSYDFGLDSSSPPFLTQLGMAFAL